MPEMPSAVASCRERAPGLALMTLARDESEEDGARGEPGERLYTTLDDLMRVVDRLGAGELGP
jgi:hypothetical protein